MDSIFKMYEVSYDRMSQSPSLIIGNPNLVVSIDGNFYSWMRAAPMIMSYLVFKQPLPPDVIGPSLNKILLSNDPGQRACLR